jgi:hypothetical protein
VAWRFGGLRIGSSIAAIYFHHSEVEPGGGAAPAGLRAFERLVSVDGAARRANLARLRELARLTMGEVKLFCSHDSVEFAALRGEEPQAETASPPVSAPRRPWQAEPRALRR